MNNEWGILHDLDTENGIKEYAKAGLQVHTPNIIQSMSFDQQYIIAESYTNLLNRTYKSNYPQSVKSTEELAKSINAGETYIFTLSTNKNIIAMASIVRRRNSMLGKVSLLELSKAAKLQDDETAKNVSVRYLSKYRIPWALENLPDVDFLYGSSRAAIMGKDGAPGGKQAQSIWWGGRRFGTSLPLLASNVGWNFRVGGIEPLTGFVVPADASKWKKAMEELPLFVPNEYVKQAIGTLFTEGTNGEIQPKIKVMSKRRNQEYFTFREARPPFADIVTKYYISDQAEHLPSKSFFEVNEQLAKAISQKAIIESDLATTVRGAKIMQQLLSEGWALAGWQPSEIVYGGICPIFARINPQLIDDLIQPIHYEQYFNEGGLTHTKQVLDDMYQTIYAQALKKVYET